MKAFILSTILMFGTFTSIVAQTSNDSIGRPVRNIHLELLGGSNGIGVQYDSRFKGNSAWGYGIGAGWGFAYATSKLFGFKQNYQNISVSPRLNYLLGRKNRKLELGIGVSLGYMFGTEEYDKFGLGKNEKGNLYIMKTGHVKEHKSLFNYFLFGNIGYRRQAAHGFMFRVGLTPVVGFGGKNSIDGFTITPYIGFGKSF